MFRNYLTTAWRNFRKHKSFSLINVAGLAVGMACFVLIMLYVQFELSFDRFHENVDRIYRVVAHQPGNVFLGTDHFAVTQAILGKTLQREFPEVLHATTLDDYNNVLFAAGDKSFYENEIILADPEIFEIFTFPLRQGDPQTALVEPFTIVLSETLARKYFGDENPIGKVLRYQDKHDLKVTGVMKEVPKNSHFHPNALLSFQTEVAINPDKKRFMDWGNSSYYTYILVRPDFDPQAFDAKLVGIVKKYHTEDWRDKENPHRYYVQQLKDIHLYSHINFDIGKNNDIRYIYLLAGLAVIIILTACINYMNLTTARSSLRAKEVGMRKVVGASRWQLLKQFIGESMLLTVTAALIALLIVELFLPVFSKLVERELALPLLLQGQAFAGLMLAIFLVGVISGSYPALLLTAFQPAKVLKGEVKDSRGRSHLRSALVVFQFAASVGLILCTATVQKQLQYIKNKKLGYNREQVLVMRMRDREARKKFELIKADLLANPNFLKVTVSGHLPTNIGSSSDLGWTEREGQPALQSYNTPVDYDFLDVFEIELVEGRNFSREFSTDSTQAFIINEKLRDLLGWESAVGKAFGRDDDKPEGVVIGVMKNFHMHSFRLEIQPLFIQLNNNWGTNASARLRADNLPAAIAHARQVWQKYSPHYPFEYFFLDDEFNRMYQAEEKLSAIFGYFTFLAVFIACLGLFGLASFTAERKTKEIGIRKVLGASIGQLLLLLSQDFMKLVLAANLIAWPIVWYAMKQWLQGFAYRTSLGWQMFMLTAATALLIALVTVSFQTLKAALANPVEALRYE
jgi:putative ABC transport system permease protein